MMIHNDFSFFSWIQKIQLLIDHTHTHIHINIISFSDSASRSIVTYLRSHKPIFHRNEAIPRYGLSIVRNVYCSAWFLTLILLFVGLRHILPIQLLRNGTKGSKKEKKTEHKWTRKRSFSIWHVVSFRVRFFISFLLSLCHSPRFWMGECMCFYDGFFWENFEPCDFSNLITNRAIYFMEYRLLHCPYIMVHGNKKTFSFHSLIHSLRQSMYSFFLDAISRDCCGAIWRRKKTLWRKLFC